MSFKKPIGTRCPVLRIRSPVLISEYFLMSLKMCENKTSFRFSLSLVTISICISIFDREGGDSLERRQSFRKAVEEETIISTDGHYNTLLCYMW